MKKWLILIGIVVVGVVVWQFLGSRETYEAPTETDSPETRVEESAAPIKVFEGEASQETTFSNDFVDMKLSYPAFADQDLSAEIKLFIDKEIAQFKSDISFDDFPIEERNRIKEFGFKYSLESRYELHEGKGLSSIIFDFNTYTGGAHGGHYVKSLNYTTNGERITIGDLFVPESAYLLRLSELSRTKLKASLDENLGNWAEDGTAPTTDNFNTFYFGSDGMLHIIFQPYQVAPWAAGVPEISITPVELGDTLNEIYR